MNRNYTGRDYIVISIYVIIFTFCFFLMFIGILRIFEVNDYFGNDAYPYVKIWCEPRGFFGWGYECDFIGYQKSMGYIMQDRFPNMLLNIS